MYKKFLFIIIFILTILGKGGNKDYTDSAIDSNILSNNTQIVETIKEGNVIATNKNVKEKDKNVNQETIKQDSVVENKSISKNTNIKQEENNSNVELSKNVNVDSKQETKEVIKEEANEEKKEEIQIKEEVIEYNDLETKKMINDINILAKQNPDLWDKEGNPLYEVKIDKSAMNGEYMYPYSIERIKGKVLNVFPVRFLVYAVDIQRPGFQKEMKYYIWVTNL